MTEVDEGYQWAATAEMSSDLSVTVGMYSSDGEDRETRVTIINGTPRSATTAAATDPNNRASRHTNSPTVIDGHNVVTTCKDS